MWIDNNLIAPRQYVQNPNWIGIREFTTSNKYLDYLINCKLFNLLLILVVILND